MDIRGFRLYLIIGPEENHYLSSYVIFAGSNIPQQIMIDPILLLNYYSFYISFFLEFDNWLFDMGFVLHCRSHDLCCDSRMR